MNQSVVEGLVRAPVRGNLIGPEAAFQVQAAQQQRCPKNDEKNDQGPGVVLSV
jgi:hypothetical protein